MYKLFVLAVVCATAQAGLIANPLGYAGLNCAGLGCGLGYNGLGYNGLGYNGLGYANNYGYGLGLNGAYAGHAIAAPAIAAAPAAYATPAVAALPVANKYALPAPRVIEEAPIVETIPEKVEQHGYSVRY